MGARGDHRSPPKAWARAEPTLWRGATAPRMAGGVAGGAGTLEKTICYQTSSSTTCAFRDEGLAYLYVIIDESAPVSRVSSLMRATPRRRVQ